jgi:hypothetical protein
VQEIDGINLESSLSLTLMDYVHPNEVVRDDRLSAMEKRALLCAWASDACAVESRPGFRWLPGTPGPILVDHIFTALRALDELTGSLRDVAYDAISDRQTFPIYGRHSNAVDAIAG